MKEDKRKYNGGHANGGRKSKSEENRLIEKLTPLEPLAFAKLEEAMSDGKDWAIKMFFEYMFGRAKQQNDINILNEKLIFTQLDLDVN